MRPTKTRFYAVKNTADNQIFQSENGKLSIFNTREQAKRWAEWVQEMEPKEYKIKEIKILLV